MTAVIRNACPDSRFTNQQVTDAVTKLREGVTASLGANSEFPDRPVLWAWEIVTAVNVSYRPMLTSQIQDASRSLRELDLQLDLTASLALITLPYEEFEINPIKERSPTGKEEAEHFWFRILHEELIFRNARLRPISNLRANSYPTSASIVRQIKRETSVDIATEPKNEEEKMSRERLLSEYRHYREVSRFDFRNCPDDFQRGVVGFPVASFSSLMALLKILPKNFVFQLTHRLHKAPFATVLHDGMVYIQLRTAKGLLDAIRMNTTKPSLVDMKKEFPCRLYLEGIIQMSGGQRNLPISLNTITLSDSDFAFKLGFPSGVDILHMCYWDAFIYSDCLSLRNHFNRKEYQDAISKYVYWFNK